MKSLFFLFIAVSTFNVEAASMVTYSGAPTAVKASGTETPVFPQSEVALPDGTKALLELSGAGVRVKSVFLVPVNVYVTASYVADPKVFATGTAIEGIQNSPVRVLKITLLRALTGSEIRSSFEDALDFNGVDINQTAFVNIFSQFTFNGKAGDSFTLISYPHNGMEAVTVELPEKTFTEENKDLGVDLWKVWFGTPVDNGIKELQLILTGKK